MKLLEKIRGGVIKKAALAAALMGGFLAFVGAGTASAHPRVFVSVGGPVVVGGYYAPPPYYYGPAYGPVYVGPRYYYGPRYGYYYGPRHRFWDERYHCWRYR